MASLSERARRRSSLFFGNSFSLSSLVKSPPTPSEQSSYSNLKHDVRLNSSITARQSSRSKHTPIEPLFQDSYLVSKEYLTSDDEQSCVDSQEPASPTFSEDYQFGDKDALGGDNYDKKDSLEDFGLGLAFETYKPNDVARKVSIIVCKPKQVYISPPTSPTSPLYARTTSSTTSPLRHSYSPLSTPVDTDIEAQQASYFGSWYAAYDRESADFSGSTNSTATSSRTSSSSTSDSSRYTETSTISNHSMLPADSFLVSAQRLKSTLGRANALKRNSHRLSTSFPKSFLAKATAEDIEQMPPPYRPATSPLSPTGTVRPTTSMSMRPAVEATRPSTSASYRPTAPRAPMLQIPNFSRPEHFPPPPEIPMSQTSVLKKKKSIADVWFKRKSVGNLLV